MPHPQISMQMFLLLLALFGVRNMWKKFVLIDHSCIPLSYKGIEDWSSIYSPKDGGGYIFPKKERGW